MVSLKPGRVNEHRLFPADQAEGLVQHQEEAETAMSEGEEAAVPPMVAPASRLQRVSAEPNACVDPWALGLSIC